MYAWAPQWGHGHRAVETRVVETLRLMLAAHEHAMPQWGHSFPAVEIPGPSVTMMVVNGAAAMGLRPPSYGDGSGGSSSRSRRSSRNGAMAIGAVETMVAVSVRSFTKVLQWGHDAPPWGMGSDANPGDVEYFLQWGHGVPAVAMAMAALRPFADIWLQ